MGTVEGKIERRGGKQMPKDNGLGKKWRARDRYIGRYEQHPGMFLYGLGYCRLAAALTERELPSWSALARGSSINWRERLGGSQGIHGPGSKPIIV
jgi:hypothetical protein